MSARKPGPPPIRFWTPLRVMSTVIVLGMVAAFGVSSCNSNDPDTKPRTITAVKPNPPSPTINEGSLTSLPQVVLDTELKSANGKPIKLGDYSGKVMLVNLWATWCGPCRTETPELVKLHKEYQDRVEMIGLSTE